MKYIEGNVCAPKGFKAAGMYCGIRKNPDKKDLALIACEVECSAAAVYTQNKVCGAPIAVTRANLANGKAQAVVCNSGNANTCNADGPEKAQKTCAFTAAALGLAPEDIIVASTGVIGQPLDTDPMEKAMPALAAALSAESGMAAAEAIMTTDTIPKAVAVEFELGGKTCRIGAICKGSGMIHPNLATMLCFVTSDVAIAPAMLQKALSAAVADSFNMITVDGDTSTNDMVSVMASGLAGNAEIREENADYNLFAAALKTVCTDLAKLMAGDGEGATKLLACSVVGAADELTAKTIAKSVVGSSLFKAAMFGADANWGRVLCAAGYSGADFDPTLVDVSFSSAKGSIEVCKNGGSVDFSEEIAKEILLEKEITTHIDLHSGTACATAWGCDLTYDYVRINGDYRS